MRYMLSRDFDDVASFMIELDWNPSDSFLDRSISFHFEERGQIYADRYGLTLVRIYDLVGSVKAGLYKFASISIPEKYALTITPLAVSSKSTIELITEAEFETYRDIGGLEFYTADILEEKQQTWSFPF